MKLFDKLNDANKINKFGKTVKKILNQNQETRKN